MVSHPTISSLMRRLGLCTNLAIHFVTSHAAMQTKLLDSKQSISAAAVFGPEGSDSVLYSSPLMQDKLIEYNYKQSNVLRGFGMQHHVTALSIAADGSLVAYAQANGTVGYMQYKTGSHTILAGKVAVLDCSVLVNMMILFELSHREMQFACLQDFP